jgi:GNAT superfamily N-acetyltransferase
MSSDELVFRDYRPQDKEVIIGLLAGGRAAQFPQAKRAVFDWQFFANPLAAGRSPFIIGTLNDEIVAINGLMPVSVRAGGQVMQACWTLDTYVSGNYRGRGFGKTLLGKVSVSAPVMLAFGISDMSDPILMKLNWELDTAMAAMYYHAHELGLKGLVKNLMTRSARTFRIKPGAAVDLLTVEAAVSESDMDGLWTRVSGQYPNAVERNAAYLSWRYQNAPELRYRWTTARQGGKLRALLITRHHPEESVIVDYVGPLDEPSLLSSLIEFARVDMVEMGTQRIRCEANHPVVIQALEAQGFRRYRKPGRFRIISHLPTSTAVAPWFIMTGDSDNDLLAL